MQWERQDSKPRLVNPVLAAAYADFQGLKHSESGRVVLKLLDSLIDSIRIENDTVETQSVARNQGKIDILLKMKSLLERE